MTLNREKWLAQAERLKIEARVAVKLYNSLYPCSSGSGGPTREDQASPARVMDPDAPRQARAIRAENLIADMTAALNRCDKAIIELSSIQIELAMIRRDMGELHGLPIEP